MNLNNSYRIGLLPRFGLVLILGFVLSCSQMGVESQTSGTTEDIADKKVLFDKNLNLFFNLDPLVATKIQVLHADLLHLDPEERNKLWHAAESFSLWLGQLDQTEKQSILSLEDPKARLAQVRKLREGQWLLGLPKADQDKIKEYENDPDGRALLISRIRAEEIERKSKHWEMALRPAPGPLAKATGVPKGAAVLNSRPAKWEEMPTEVQQWINTKLLPRLSPFEKNQLRLATGHWPDYPRTIYQLIRDHFLLPPSLHHVKEFEDLPNELREKYTAAAVIGIMEKKGWTPPTSQGQDFALAMAKWAVQEKIPTGFLGPTSSQTLPQPWRQLVEKNLSPRLVKEERQFLRRAEGKWPEYPRALIDVLVSKRMAVPGNILPGLPSLWQDALSPK